MQITDFNAYTQKAWRLFRMSFHSQFMQGNGRDEKIYDSNVTFTVKLETFLKPNLAFAFNSLKYFQQETWLPESFQTSSSGLNDENYGALVDENLIKNSLWIHFIWPKRNYSDT